jgi:hypothetical protein
MYTNAQIVRVSAASDKCTCGGGMTISTDTLQQAE